MKCLLLIIIIKKFNEKMVKCYAFDHGTDVVLKKGQQN